MTTAQIRRIIPNRAQGTIEEETPRKQNKHHIAFQTERMISYNILSVIDIFLFLINVILECTFDCFTLLHALIWQIDLLSCNIVFVCKKILCVPEKRNRELSMFYHNLIAIIIHKWHIFVKLRSSSFIWFNSYDAYFTHERLKTIWREGTKKLFWGRYLNFKENITFLESLISALSYDTSIRIY